MLANTLFYTIVISCKVYKNIWNWIMVWQLECVIKHQKKFLKKKRTT